MFDYNALQLRNKVITVNTVCYSIFLYVEKLLCSQFPNNVDNARCFLYVYCSSVGKWDHLGDNINKIFCVRF